jgi:hypothetical protein
MIRSITLALLALTTAPISSETVSVVDRGIVDLKPFACTDTPRSSIIQRVCYAETQNYMLINVRGTYHQFCGLPPLTFGAFATAASMGQFYNQKIKGSGSESQFDCRTHHPPIS